MRNPLITACLSVLLLAGCSNYSNTHGDQELAPVTRLTTKPAGCTLFIERLNMTLETPCDLAHTVYPTDVVWIRKDGYLPFRGKLEELRKVSSGTYECVLQK